MSPQATAINTFLEHLLLGAALVVVLLFALLFGVGALGAWLRMRAQLRRERRLQALEERRAMETDARRFAEERRWVDNFRSAGVRPPVYFPQCYYTDDEASWDATRLLAMGYCVLQDDADYHDEYGNPVRRIVYRLEPARWSALYAAERTPARV